MTTRSTNSSTASQLVPGSMHTRSTRKFAVHRASPPNLPWDIADAAGLQHIVNLGIGNGQHFEPRFGGLSWVRSYWEQDTGWGVCLFSGDSAAQVAAYQALCDAGYTEIVELDEEETGVSGISEYPGGWHASPEDAPLVAVVGLAVDIQGLCRGPLNTAWIRTYIEVGTGRAVASLRAEYFRDEARAALVRSHCDLHRIVELSPRNYIG